MRTFALVVLVLAACGKKSDSGAAASGGEVASCYSESMHSCREYRGMNLALGSDSLTKLCTAVDKTAKFSDTPCATAGVIGTCKMDAGKDFFYDGYVLASSMEADCKASSGTFAK
ncbi:MAG TPA: hypothetical protein VMZ53_24105 [Kofleriaceae bacterium]|nr:hypothetical protein [Kofleriaceae bacterium]